MKIDFHTHIFPDHVAPRTLEVLSAAAHIPVKWQNGSYHITVAFIYGDEQVKALCGAFERCLDGREAPSLTFDKVDVFEAKNSHALIINLTSSQPSPELFDLVKTLRQEALDQGAEVESAFMLHVTLGRINTASTSLEEVKKIVDGIPVPPFTLHLTKATYRYFRGAGIGSWKMG